MATHNVTISNPSASPVTVDAQTVPAGAVVQLTLNDTTTDLYLLVDAGCVVTSTTTPGKVSCAVCQYPSGLGQVIEPYYL